ncbi:MAG TPA: hypothetical protein VMH87_05185 [Pseudomonadales bacterium]|nr:hypothetical protein [Pseudomonadales bacterium]
MSTLNEELSTVKSAAQQMPPTENIANILAVIAKGEPYANLFFDSLNDPSWLPILNNCGYFSNLPTTKTMSDGTQIQPFHLPLFGLAKLAPQAPHAVASILQKLELPENPTIGDQVLRCIAAIREPTCIPVLHSILIRVIQKPTMSSWIWIQELLKYWMEIKAHEDVFVILNAYFSASVKAGTGYSRGSDEWMLQQVDDGALQALTSVYPNQVAAIVFNALMLYAEHWKTNKKEDAGIGELVENSFTGEGYVTSFTVDDFTVKGVYKSFEAILAHRLYLASSSIYKEGDKHKIEMLDALLRSHSWILFRRIRWRLYSEYPDMGLIQARKDVLERIPYLSLITCEHTREFAELLHIYSEKFKYEFLPEIDVQHFVQSVLRGPLDRFSHPVPDSYKELFYSKQLWPIAILFHGKNSQEFNAILGKRKISFKSYSPQRVDHADARFIEQIAPVKSENLEALSNDDLWKLLNTWESGGRRLHPDQWWVQEDYGALAKQFALFVQKNVERFPAATKWWENIERPEPLSETLNLGTEQLKALSREKESKGKISEQKWLNWLGLSGWIIEQSNVAKDRIMSGPEETQDRSPRIQIDWYWPKVVTANFLIAAAETQVETLESYIGEMSSFLKILVENDDYRLKGDSNEPLEEGLTTAINSVRGRALEGILKLALHEKNGSRQIPPWIFPFICSRLNLSTESPAIFALIGANLRLFIYLFGASLKQLPELLFPENRPTHKNAALVAHFLFDHPMTEILEVLPSFLNRAISAFKEIVNTRGIPVEKRKHRDFMLQLGVHIGFYTWNGTLAIRDAEKALAEYFTMADRETRGSLIRQIAWIFEKAEKDADKEESKAIFNRVMHIWDWRYDEIVKMSREAIGFNEFKPELAGFLNWIVCECFPFDWRIDRWMKVVSHLKEMPEVFHILEQLPAWSESMPERLEPSLQILESILLKPNDRIRWQIQGNKLKPLLIRGLQSPDQNVQARTNRCQELLLKMGFFELIDLQKIAS